MPTVRQSALGTHFEYPVPGVKVGKVIRVRPGDQTIDVAFLDGNFAKQIPVISGWASTVDGFAHLTAPTVDDNDPTKPTYEPNAAPNFSSIAPLLSSVGLPFLTGISASWYGPTGNPTASGAPYIPGGFTAAFAGVPFGTLLSVFAPATGRRITVKVNDRPGPAVPPGGIDLSEGAANALGILSIGRTPVDVESPSIGESGVLPVGLVVSAAAYENQVGNRDVYAVCLPAEGFIVGSSGYLCMGFLYNSDGEMLFPADPTTDNPTTLTNFADFLIARHTSDVQFTIDKFGTTSLEHPKMSTLGIRTRISMGDMDATDIAHRSVLDVTGKAKNFVDLTFKDSNGRYQLRNNFDKTPGIILTDVSGSYALLDGKGIVDIRNAINDKVVMTPGASIEISQDNGNKIIISASQDNENILIEDRFGNSIRMGEHLQSGGVISISDINGNRVDMTPRGMNVSSPGEVNVTGDTVNIDGAKIILNGGLQPIARVGDATSCPAGPGTIVSGSPSVSSG